MTLPRTARRPVGWGLVVALALAVGGHVAHARERVFRLLDERDGLPVAEVTRLAQDTRGFIWIGTFAGLVRYDGEEMRQWAPERLNGHVSVLATGPDGEVVVRVEPGRAGDVDPAVLYEVVNDGIEPVSGPDGTALTGVTDAVFGTAGQLCATAAGDVLCRGPDGSWVRHTFDSGAERAILVRRGLSAGVLAVTSGGVWAIETGGRHHRLAAMPGITNVVAHPNGSLFATTFGPTGRVHRLDNGRPVTVLDLDGRPIGLAVRGDVVWASFDRFVAAIRSDAPPEVIGPEDDLSSGGPLLVDQDGSLWLGTYRGLMHLPEPDTIIWTEREGLASRHTRFVAAHENTLWVGTWQGLSQLRYEDGRWRAHPGAAFGRDRMCLDGRGRLWMGNLGQGLVRHDPQRSVLFGDPAMHNWIGCAARPDGTLWLSTNQGIFVAPLDNEPPRRLAANPDDPSGSIFFRQILEDRKGRLWVAANEQICHTATTSPGWQDNAAWRCQTIADSRGIASIIQLNDGDVWLATDRVGVWRYHDEQGTWKQLPGSSALPSYSLRGLVSSIDGTVWILGHGTVVRVRDDHDAPAGWTVVERLSGLHGLPSAAAEHLLERPGGSVWIATIVGLVHVPASARRVRLPPPAVELVDVSVDGARVALGASPWRLKAGEVAELRFAALSFRDRGRLRHQYRLHADDPWIGAPGPPSSFRFADLGTGSYDLQVRASLDGLAWTPNPAAVRLDVLPPWYGRPWAVAIFVSILGIALYVAYQLRLAFLLRLERQRTRIAMDLHDEIGSGLGSIHILAGLAADRTPADSRAAGLVRNIADTAGELGSSLSEIVWSLGSRSDTLDALVSHLAERAVRLFPGEVPSFSLDVPDSLPLIRLPLGQRRNIALIALEAMHNAAPHAQATHVVLGLRPEGRRWRLWVADDGRGPGDKAAGSDAGTGLESMTRRAAEIGGVLTVTRNAAGGVTVVLVFDPGGKRWRP